MCRKPKKAGKNRWEIERKGKISFKRVWFGTAFLLIIVAMAVMVPVSDFLLIALMQQEQIRVSERAYETTLLLKDRDEASLKDCSRLLNLESSQMAAAVYDGQGNLVCESDTDSYEDRRRISKEKYLSKENYRVLLERLKEIPMNDRKENAGYEEADVFGISYLYGRKYFTVAGATYTLRYGALISPWNRYGRRFIVSGFGILSGMFLLSAVIAGGYYKIYRERIKAEEYYRNTSNALAHDLKTPLMAISGYAEILQENIHTEKRNYYADGILKNAAMMDSIIESMLELARLENPRIILVKEEVNLRKMTEEILELFQAEIGLKELKVSLQGMEASIVKADRSLMRRALENVISNAVRYTPERNEIIITMDAEEYQIKNTGVIISADKLEHVWEPFVKGESARNDVRGTGIGLTIVKQIMELHGFACRIRNGENCVNVSICFDSQKPRRWRKYITERKKSKKVKINI